MDSAYLSGFFIWGAIAVCVSQSAIFSGMNLAVFSISRLRLEVEAASGSQDAEKVLGLRENSNHMLTTILWGNVGVNVLLALLSNSVMTGVVAFIFSTFVITFVGEILPQAYFSRHALRVAALLSPVLAFYRILLYPVAKPCAMILDVWLGQEGIQYFREHDIREVIKKHIEADETDIDRLEGVGALNFLAIDDLLVVEEGEHVDPYSIITLPLKNDLPDFPAFDKTTNDPFLRQIEASKKKWVIIADADGNPHFALDSDEFLRDVLFGENPVNPISYCHRPIIVTNLKLPLGSVLCQLKECPHCSRGDIIDRDIVLIWGNKEKRVITGADILGRLLHGI